MHRRLAPLAAALLLAACSGGTTTVSSRPTIDVAGTRVSSADVSTVGQALREAGVDVPAGQLLSIRTHRPLGPDAHGGQVLVDGTPTLVASRVEPGAVITVEGGGDVTEPIETVISLVHANKGFASLHRASRPGRVRVIRGAVSHEVVSSTVLSRPFDGVLLSARPVALTFDDGPNPKYTPQVLAMLAAAHVHATFCIIGRQAQQYPALIRQIVADGHTLCNHTWDHDERLAQRTPAQITVEMSKAQAAITQASGGVAPKLFRAPGGSWSPQVELIARKLHMTPLKWDVDPSDWKKPGAGHIIQRVMAHVHPGAIVLLHDGGGKRDQTVAALHYFLVRLPAYKYRFQVPQTA
ncbi:MAG: polysaccharide deacetylase [Frankiales bacterium]|nr:polysaccharide deacetylase [Frankiales bacterium]